MQILHAAFTADTLFAWAEPNTETLPTIGGATRKVTAWLPSVRDEPIPSLDEQGRKATRIAPREVSAVPLTPAHTLDLLARCTGQRVLAPGVIIGADLAYWTAGL